MCKYLYFALFCPCPLWLFFKNFWGGGVTAAQMGLHPESARYRSPLSETTKKSISENFHHNILIFSIKTLLLHSNEIIAYNLVVV